MLLCSDSQDLWHYVNTLTGSKIKVFYKLKLKLDNLCLRMSDFPTNEFQMSFSIAKLVPWSESKFRDLFNKVLTCNKDEGTFHVLLSSWNKYNYHTPLIFLPFHLPICSLLPVTTLYCLIVLYLQTHSWARRKSSLKISTDLCSHCTHTIYFWGEGGLSYMLSCNVFLLRIHTVVGLFFFTHSSN